ncbi:MAG TPA: NADH:ubiquinone reductase (Na(+)-transporting) subunit C [Flavobacteriales bacterium]|jgi:Na+-transporting NADH:ubiquinone oxidoreductase subunit C|nr:NADH:ubiquinone reductase (Na(+)-transporting) subunit C [Flavobacteriales bacterium]
MAFNKNSNVFTFGFAVGLVVIVGAVLAFLSISLKPAQQENMRQEKMKFIMMSIRAMTEDDDMGNAPDLFDKYIIKRVILDSSGDVISEEEGKVDRLNEADAFNVDLQKQYKSLAKPIISKFKKDKSLLYENLREVDYEYPLYVAQIDGQQLFIVPMEGTGLWGPIWGYVSFREDMNTIYGATFAHEKETPGLGAEISTTNFQDQFVDKTIFKNEKFVSIDVMKGGGGQENPHGVDGITGGTITSFALRDMIYNTLKMYEPYFKKNTSEKS